MLHCYVTWWVYLRMRQTGGIHKSKKGIKKQPPAPVIIKYVIFVTFVYIGSFLYIVEVCLLIMQCRCHGIILNSMVHRLKNSWKLGKYFFSKVNRVFTLAHCVWRWLGVYICLEMRKKAAAILSASQSTGQAGRPPKPQKRQGFMPPLHLYHINHILSKCI